jgi:hypothetical protein
MEERSIKYFKDSPAQSIKNHAKGGSFNGCSCVWEKAARMSADLAESGSGFT